MSPFQKRRINEEKEEKKQPSPSENTLRKWSYSWGEKWKELREKHRKRDSKVFTRIQEFFASKKKSEKKPKRWKNIFKKLFYTGFALFLLGCLTILIILVIAFHDDTLPDISDPKAIVFSEVTTIYDSTGEIPLRSVRGDENRTVITIDEINQNMINAILAAEDDQFFNHGGYDLPAITKAVCYMGFSKLKLSSIGNTICPPRGGSTITQQLAKNLFLTPERSIKRKLRELVLAVRLEDRYSKEEILEMYLNKINLSSDLYGVEAVSKTFFDKSADELTISEAAIVAALPKYPGAYSPYSGTRTYSKLAITHEEIQEKGYETFEEVHAAEGITWYPGLMPAEIELANGKKDIFPGRADDVVLKRMNLLGFITDLEYENAKNELLETEFNPYKEEMIAPHFVFWAQDKLEKELEKRYGEMEPDQIANGGYKVITTLDLDLQKMAEESVEKQAEINLEKYNINNTALVSMDPQTGYIKALVGSVDYYSKEIDGETNIIINKRQPGSTFKPIVYAAAFLEGKLSPGSILFDVKTYFGSWDPQNFDGKFRGPVSVRESLGKSLNIPAVKASVIADYNNVYNLANQLGISFDLPPDEYGNSIALGAAEATPIDMATAFSIFANGGKKVEPVVILRVEDRFGNLLFSLEDEEEEEEKEQVLNSAVAYMVTDMLSDAESRGPGWNAQLQLPGRPNIAKTGTATLDHPTRGIPWPGDAWTIGGTPQLITAVWAGNNYRETELMTSTAGGLTNAGPIWKNFMTQAHEELPVEKFSIPKSGVSRLQVSKLSGKLPAPKTPESLITTEVFATEFVPTEEDSSLVVMEIDRVSEKLITEKTPEKAKKEVAVMQLHSYYPEMAAWEDPVQKWLSENAEPFLEELGLNNSEILSTPPSEIDDVHTEDTEAKKATFQFLSPKAGDIVSPPKITISLDIQAENGFGSVLFLWDDKISMAFNEEQENYIIRISRDSEGTHKLTAVVTDELYYTTEESIEVEIGEDTDKPKLEIIRPGEGESVAGGVSTLLLAEASDQTGAVQKVNFYIDGESVGSAVSAPYEVNWKSPNTNASHALRVIASDVSGNVTTETLSFKTKKLQLPTEFSIVRPQDGANLSCPDATIVRVGVAGETKEKFERIEIWSEDSEHRRKIIGEYSELSETGYFEASFTPDHCGEWRFYSKAFLTGDVQRTSPRVFVEFEE